MNLNQLASQPIPAWLALVPALILLALELLRGHREAGRPDLHAALIDLHRETVKSHSGSVAAIAELARGGEADH